MLGGRRCGSRLVALLFQSSAVSTHAVCAIVQALLLRAFLDHDVEQCHTTFAESDNIYRASNV